MFARLTVRPMRKSLEVHRSWTRTFQNWNVDCSFAEARKGDNSASHPIANSFVDSNKTGCVKQNAFACSENVDVMLEGIFQRGIPLPHVGTTVFKGGSVEEHIFNLPEALTILDPSPSEEGMQLMNRNARRPKKANKGARPCSRASRRKKKEKIGKRGR